MQSRIRIAQSLFEKRYPRTIRACREVSASLCSNSHGAAASRESRGGRPIDCREFSGHLTDPEEASVALSSALGPLRVLAPPAGDFELEFKCLELQGILSFTESSFSGFSLIPEGHFDGYVLLMPQSGGISLCLSGGARLQNRVACGLICDARESVRIEKSAQVRLSAFAFPADDLHLALQEALGRPLGERLRFLPHLPRSSPVRVIQSIADALWAGLGERASLLASPLVAQNLKLAIVNTLIELLPHNYSVRLRAPESLPGSGQIKRAIEFIESNAGAPISASDIARAAGISLRSLQHGFRRARLDSPVAYLRQVRLRRARADLTAPSPRATVTRIAYRWGFANPGSFAAHYRRAFGELPSVTLQRGQEQLGLTPPSATRSAKGS